MLKNAHFIEIFNPRRTSSLVAQAAKAEVLSLGNTQINLEIRSLIRNFTPENTYYIYED